MKCDPLQRWRYDIHSKVVATQLRTIVLTFLLSDPSVVTCNHAVVSVAGAGRAQAGRSLARRRIHVVDDFASASKRRKKIIKPDWIGFDESIPRRTERETRLEEESPASRLETVVA